MTTAPGPRMRLIAAYIADHPGCNKLAAARHGTSGSPYSSSVEALIRGGYAGAVKDRVNDQYHLFLTSAGRLLLSTGGPCHHSFPVEVVFAHPDAGYKGAQEHARKYLTVGAVYTINKMEVGQSSTYLTLYGVPRSEQFGSELFEPFWPPDEEDECGE